jgi:hypothetical protein
MYLFKALYIRAYFVTALVMTFWCLSLLGQGKWLWLAPLLTWSPLWLHNTWRMQVANSGYQDDREKLAMSLALAGVGIMLIAGERDHILWWTLAGLFALLLYIFLISKLTYGVRETKGDKDLLPQLIGSHHPEARLVVFFHAASCPYAKMAMRELLTVLKTKDEALKPEQVVAVFADELPPWVRKFQQAGGRCWVDTDGEVCQQLGLWLRDGNVLLDGGRNALRPALAAINSEGQVGFWEVAKNFRLPPSLHTHWERVKRAL